MLHGHVIKTNFYRDIVVQSALIDVYAGLGMLDDAWQIVHMMSHRDAITYTSLSKNESNGSP